MIKGRELAFSSISKHENGMLERGWAESDFSFPLRGKEYRFRGGFPANFHPCGQLKRAFLVEAQSFFIAGGDSKFEFTISFHKNGRVSLGYLSQDQTFHVGGREYLFKAGLYTGFFESGKVRRGFLKGDHTVPIGGKNYTFREASIFFYESGAVHEGFLLNGGTYRGKDYLAGKLGP